MESLALLCLKTLGGSDLLVKPRGNYSASASPSYTVNDYVTYNGNTYVCKADNPSNVAPTTGGNDDTYWQIQVFKGAKGDKGDTGEKGDAGEIVSVNATIDNKIGIPSIEIVNGGTPTEREITLNFKNMKGEKGEQGESAVTALNPRGDYDVNADPYYTLTDYITHTDGNTYVCKADNPNNVAPTTGRNDDLYWQLMALRGAKGEKGDAGGISDDESATLKAMNETNYNVSKVKLFNLNDDESHLIFKGTLKTAKNNIQSKSFKLLDLPQNEKIVYPDKISVQITSASGYKTNEEMRRRFYLPSGYLINEVLVDTSGNKDVRAYKILNAERMEVSDTGITIDSNFYAWGDYGSDVDFQDDYALMIASSLVQEISLKNQRSSFDTAFKNGEIDFIMTFNSSPQVVYSINTLMYNETTDYIDPSAVENKVFRIRGWKLEQVEDPNNPGSYLTTYDKSGKAVLAAKDEEFTFISYGQTKTIYVVDLSTEDKGLVDGASIDDDEMLGKNLFDSNGNVIAQTSGVSKFHIVKAKTVTFNKDYIYYSLLYYNGCNVDSQGREANYNLVSDPDFSFGVGSNNTDRNVEETADGGIAKAPYGFSGTVNVQPKIYGQETTTTIGVVASAVYEETTDTAIDPNKDYYRAVSDGSQTTFELVVNPVVEDIGDYYELVTKATPQLHISGSKAVSDVFISTIF